MDHEQLSILELKRGNGEAWDKVYARFSRVVFYHVFRKLNHDRELARDVTQQTFLRAIESIGRVRGDETVLGFWLMGIANHNISEISKKERMWRTAKSDAAVQLWPELLETEPSARDRLLQIEDSELVEIVLGTLSRKWESVLRWRYCDRLSLREIGRRLNITHKGAEALVRRARAKFVEEFFEMADAKKDLLLLLEDYA